MKIRCMLERKTCGWPAGTGLCPQHGQRPGVYRSDRLRRAAAPRTPSWPPCLTDICLRPPRPWWIRPVRPKTCRRRRTSSRRRPRKEREAAAAAAAKAAAQARLNALKTGAVSPRTVSRSSSLAADSVIKNNFKKLGNYRLSFYCPCATCNGRANAPTKLGTTLTEGRTHRGRFPCHPAWQPCLHRWLWPLHRRGHRQRHQGQPHRRCRLQPTAVHISSASPTQMFI